MCADASGNAQRGGLGLDHGLGLGLRGGVKKVRDQSHLRDSLMDSLLGLSE